MGTKYGEIKLIKAKYLTGELAKKAQEQKIALEDVVAVKFPISSLPQEPEIVKVDNPIMLLNKLGEEEVNETAFKLNEEMTELIQSN